VDPALLLDDEPFEVGDALVEGQDRHGLVSELGVGADHVGVFELIDEGKRMADGWEQEVATRFVGLGLERHAQLIALLDGVVAQQVHGLGVAIEGSANRLGGGHLAALPATPEESLRDVRDRCVLLLGFAGALRRSEITSLDCSDVREADGGLVLRLRRSKTDPEAAGQEIGIPKGSH